jgi:acyl-CoA synthetase (AMP-forming)/AMP-acid ligase II/acyl carrier protein
LPACVQSVLLGGERVSADDLTVWRRTVPAGVDLWNCYGLTETCVTSTIYRDDRDVPADRFPAMPLGGPCPTVTTYVLDDRLRQAPAESVGELFIGGPGVAAGYWDDPKGTAAAFIPNPFGPGRLYRTGDLGTVDGSGLLHFVGRVDRQVKINGFRVNPGEIEGALTAHPAVHRACVVSRREASGHTGLVAYLELAGPTQDVQHVKDHLASRVPAFMMPASVVVLETMPLLSSGKIDVDALTRRVDAGSASTGESAAVGHTAEMMEIWCRALRIDECGPDVDLLDLGGNSLSGMRIAARVSDHFGITIQFRDVLENRTPAALAQYVELLQRAS